MRASRIVSLPLALVVSALLAACSLLKSEGDGEPSLASRLDTLADAFLVEHPPTTLANFNSPAFKDAIAFIDYVNGPILEFPLVVESMAASHDSLSEEQGQTVIHATLGGDSYTLKLSEGEVLQFRMDKESGHVDWWPKSGALDLRTLEGVFSQPHLDIERELHADSTQLQTIYIEFWTSHLAFDDGSGQLIIVTPFLQESIAHIVWDDEGHGSITAGGNTTEW